MPTLRRVLSGCETGPSLSRVSRRIEPGGSCEDGRSGQGAVEPEIVPEERGRTDGKTAEQGPGGPRCLQVPEQEPDGEQRERQGGKQGVSVDVDRAEPEGPDERRNESDP